MSVQCEAPAKAESQAPMTVFERYLTLWVFLCILLGIALGQIFPGAFRAVGAMEVAPQVRRVGAHLSGSGRWESRRINNLRRSLG